jgi:hypothetical protein
LLNVATGAGVGLGVGDPTGLRVITSVFVTLPTSAVIVTLTDLLTASETALNPAVVVPAGTTIVEGTFRAALLLISVTDVELFAGALRLTKHAVDWTPVSDSFPQETALRDMFVEICVTPPQPARIEMAHAVSNANVA